MPQATIDIGTNSVLLLIGSPLPSAGEGAGVRVLLDEARITGLGRGLTKTFHPESRHRTLKALEEYDGICRRIKAEKVICVGTAAFRNAKDGTDFMREIGKRFGWQARIISGEEEARLSFLSVEHDFADKYPNLMALDIGGGSTEIISKEGGISLEMGTVVLTEKYLLSDPPQENEMLNLRAAIDTNLHSLNPKPYALNPVVISLAGTATTLSSINQKLMKWDPEKIQGSVIAMRELEEMIILFRRTSNEERRTIPGMVPGREDTILSGSLILKAVMEKLRVDFVVVSDRGLRYGLLYE